MPKVCLVGLPLKVAQKITGMGQYHGEETHLSSQQRMAGLYMPLPQDDYE